MIDVVFPMQKAYKQLLAGITYNDMPVKAYYQYLPDGFDDDNYIVFGSISDSDRSTCNTQGSTVSVQVVIHTKSDQYNDGLAVAAIANQVLQILLPLEGPTIDLSADRLQLTSTKKTTDRTKDWTVAGQKVYIDRILQFSHNIYYL